MAIVMRQFQSGNKKIQEHVKSTEILFDFMMTRVRERVRLGLRLLGLSCGTSFHFLKIRGAFAKQPGGGVGSNAARCVAPEARKVKEASGLR
jgi:hypothetical protein